MVCPEALAADAGKQIFEAGGSAIDALVATAFAQGVAAPFMTSIGGSAKIHYFDASTRRSVVINAATEVGSRPPPARWVASLLGRAETVGRFLVPEWENSAGYWSIMTPGFVRGCWHAFRRYGSGRLKWSDLLAPAVKLARDGVRVDAHLASSWTPNEQQAGYPPLMTTLHTTEAAAKQYLKSDGSIYREGDLYVQADLGRTLQRLADAGGDDFYTGEIGAAIAADLEAHGCTVAARDLRGYEVREDSPIEGAYRGLRVATMPAPSAGPQVLEMLAMLERFDLQELKHNSPEFVDTLARIQRVSFASRSTTDPIHDQRALRDHAASWAAKLRAGHRAEVRSGAVVEDGTTHVTVIDKTGAIAGMTHSIGTGAGSGVITPGLGFPYNNFLGHFDPRPGRPRSITPGNRLGGGPPTIVFEGDRPIMGIGAPGGSRLITSIVQVLVNSLDFRMDMSTAVTVPRFHSEEAQIVFLEPAFPEETSVALNAKGNEVRRSSYMSRVQAARILEDGTIDAGADPRGGAVRFS